jgi:hypothetical protein
VSVAERPLLARPEACLAALRRPPCAAWRPSDPPRVAIERAAGRLAVPSLRVADTACTAEPCPKGRTVQPNKALEQANATLARMDVAFAAQRQCCANVGN